MTDHPFSTPNRRIPYMDAIAQCDDCKQTSSYDAVDAYEQRPLVCKCGGRLKLYAQVPLGSPAA